MCVQLGALSILLHLSLINHLLHFCIPHSHLPKQCLANYRMPNKKQVNQPRSQLEGGPKQGVAEAAALVDMDVSTI